MITETMVLLALRQGNWAHAGTAARELSQAKGDPFMASVAAATDRCVAGDARAVAVIRMWVDLRWRSME